MPASVGCLMTNTELSRESKRFLHALWSKLDEETYPWEFKETVQRVMTYKDARGEENLISPACYGGSIDIDRGLFSTENQDLLKDIVDIFVLSFDHWIKKTIAHITEKEKCSSGIIYIRLHRGDRFWYQSWIHTEVTDLPLHAPQIAGGVDIRGINKPYTEDTQQLSHPSPMVQPMLRYTAFMDVAFVPTWD